MRRWSVLNGVVMCALVAGIVALPAPARAWQAFAKVTTSTGTIDGDAIDKGFERQITVLGLGNRIDRPLDATGAPTGAVKAGPLQMVKRFDIATPKLVTAAAVGSVLSKVEITIFKTTATGTSVPGFKITLTNALITQIDTTYDPGSDPSTLEKIELAYQNFKWTDLITGATGSAP